MCIHNTFKLKRVFCSKTAIKYFKNEVFAVMAHHLHFIILISIKHKENKTGKQTNMESSKE